MAGAWGGYHRLALGSYLDAAFDTDAEGRVNIPTVIYPSDPAHAKAEMKPITGDGYSGIQMAAGAGLIDYVLAMPLDGARPVQIDGTTVQARSAVFRKVGDAAAFYFVRKGTRFQVGDVGFQSDKPVTIHVRGNAGHVVSPGAEVTVHRGGQTVRLKLDKGMHEIKRELQQMRSAIAAGL